MSFFINYRTDDGPYAAALLDERLCARYGADNVFRDSRSMTAGSEFPPTIRKRLANSEVLLVLIGPKWLSLRDANGDRLIDRDEDWVRNEIKMAIDLEIVVIPVLLEDTALPKAHDLPPDILKLLDRQYIRLRDKSAAADLDKLERDVAEWVPVPVPTTAPETREADRPLYSGSHIQFGDHTRIGGDIVGHNKNVKGSGR